MSFENTMTTMLRARVGNLWVQTRDEYRAETLILGVASKAGYQLKCWRASVGLFDFLSDGKDQDGKAVKVRTVPEVDQGTVVAYKALEQLYGYEKNAAKQKGKGPVLVLFEDVAGVMRSDQVARWFKCVALKNRSIARDRLVQIVVVDSSPPAEGFVNVDLDLPSREELTSIVSGMGAMANLKDVDVPAIVDVVTGLEATQAQRALAQCLAEKKCFDLRTIMRAKKSLIKDAAAITWKEPPEGGLEAVGGLDSAKEYIRVAERIFRKARENQNVKRPKGFIACGIPGTGKTYLSYAVGAAFGLPVLEFSVEAAMGGIVGETEKNVDKALEIAKACAPCVLCFDELEKGLAGSGGDGRSDGGVMNRVIGRILKFLNDTREPVFVIVTMNDPRKIGDSNPELFRRGRLDKVFWVDVPNRRDRLAVLKIHAKSKGIEGVDLGAVADATRNFTGAELEAVLDEATWLAEYRNQAVTLEVCLEAIKGINPVVESWGSSGVLEATREWAKRGTIPANLPEQEDAVDDEGPKVDFDLSTPEPEVLLDPVVVQEDGPVFDPEPEPEDEPGSNLN
jgi:ATP-dependent 26S proteasome regulatory subunit